MLNKVEHPFIKMIEEILPVNLLLQNDISLYFSSRINEEEKFYNEERFSEYCRLDI